MREDFTNDPEWNEFVRNVREDAVMKIADSAFVVSLVPGDEIDIKFAVELGLAIMFDKPLLGIVQPGATVTERMRRVFDEIVVVDVDTAAGQMAMKDALDRMLDK